MSIFSSFRFALLLVCLLGSGAVFAQDDDPVAPADAEVSTDQVNGAFLPGLQNAPSRVKTLPSDRLPFEAELRTRERRIDLGLESPQQAKEPVDNILRLQF